MLKNTQKEKKFVETFSFDIISQCLFCQSAAKTQTKVIKINKETYLLLEYWNIEHENQNCYLNVLDYAKRSLSITVHERKKPNDPSKQKSWWKPFSWFSIKRHIEEIHGLKFLNASHIQSNPQMAVETQMKVIKNNKETFLLIQCWKEHIRKKFVETFSFDIISQGFYR